MAGPTIRDLKIVRELDRMEKEMQFMKNRQFVGRKVLITKTSKSGFTTPSHDAWYFGGPPDPPQIQALQHIVTFKADLQLNPWGALRIEIYDNQGRLITNVSGDGSTPGLDQLDQYVPFVDDGTLKWFVGVIGPVNMPFSVKWVVDATDTGSITTVDAYNY